MKAKGLLFFLVTVILWSCDEKRLAPDEIKPVVGKWMLNSVKQGGDAKQWELITPKDATVFEIRYDGVVLDADGLPACCAPKYLVYQGKKFTVEPKKKLAPNPSCALVLCLACDTWYLELENGQLITDLCNTGVRSRYTKL